MAAFFRLQICSCPGLLSETCGSALQWRSCPDRQIYCYECVRPGCLFKEWVPPPKAIPELEILLLDSSAIQVGHASACLWAGICVCASKFQGAKDFSLQIAAAEGAEHAVQFCGGVSAILAAHGIQCRNSDDVDDTPLMSMHMTFAVYTEVVQKIRGSNLARAGISILPQANLIPLPTISAYRFGFGFLFMLCLALANRLCCPRV